MNEYSPDLLFLCFVSKVKMMNEEDDDYMPGTPGSMTTPTSVKVR